MQIAYGSFFFYTRTGHLTTIRLSSHDAFAASRAASILIDMLAEWTDAPFLLAIGHKRRLAETHRLFLDGRLHRRRFRRRLYRVINGRVRRRVLICRFFFRIARLHHDDCRIVSDTRSPRPHTATVQAAGVTMMMEWMSEPIGGGGGGRRRDDGWAMLGIELLPEAMLGFRLREGGRFASLGSGMHVLVEDGHVHRLDIGDELLAHVMVMMAIVRVHEMRMQVRVHVLAVYVEDGVLVPVLFYRRCVISYRQRTVA